MVRRPHVFTRVNWYESDVEGLNKRLEWSYLHNKGPKIMPDDFQRHSNKPTLGIVSPHAGFSCSGPFAAHGFLSLTDVDQVDTFIVLGTNHTGMGSPISVFPDGDWETPLGIISIDSELSDELINLVNSGYPELNISKEPEAHYHEHSIDNQLPFIQYSFSNFKILPICLADHRLETCSKIGKIIARIIANSPKTVKIVASSDFTHFLSPEESLKRDQPVLDALLKYDLKEAENVSKHASICGFGPILVFLSIGKELNCSLPELLIYGHSGETCGSMDSVVAYASIKIDFK